MKSMKTLVVLATLVNIYMSSCSPLYIDYRPERLHVPATKEQEQSNTLDGQAQDRD